MVRQKYNFLMWATLALTAVALSACSTGSVRAKKEAREKVMQTSKIYCDFVNGENNPTDVEVALNISMGQKCDYEKPYSITGYKTPSDISGVVFCCSLSDKDKKKDDKVNGTKAMDLKPVDGKGDKAGGPLDLVEPPAAVTGASAKPGEATKVEPAKAEPAKPEARKPDAKRPAAPPTLDR